MLEFIADLIAKVREDPEYNKRVWDEHILEAEKLANERLANWNTPIYLWGYWRNKFVTATYEHKLNPAYKEHPGRRNPTAPN